MAGAPSRGFVISTKALTLVFGAARLAVFASGDQTSAVLRDLFQANVLALLLGERMRVVGFITQAPVIRDILDHIGRRFDPLKLPGRSPLLSDHFCPDPFPRTYGPQ